jgi:pimeloyl-ACP methyl ester carboxylesterase
LHYPAAGDVLLVMLPGVGIEAAEFAEHGMIAAVRERGLAVDVVAVRPELDLYLDGDVAAVLHREVIEPELARGVRRIWLLGISLGGMGAVLYAGAYEGVVEGVILLAPFLGTQGTIAEIEAAGGFAAWSGGAVTVPEGRMLGWLRERPEGVKVYLGYGEADRFARGHRLLAETLPAANVVTEAGGHDWGTWAGLWRKVLDAGVFGR